MIREDSRVRTPSRSPGHACTILSEIGTVAGRDAVFDL
jgi:hypothetical protein